MQHKRLVFLALLLLLLMPLATAQEEVDCEQPLEIWQVQGSGAEANCVGEGRIMVPDNIVTALTPAGFFMQTPIDRSDNDDLTSDGIYVFTGLPPVGWGINVGDRVTVDGRVKEFYNRTQLEVSGARRIEVLSSGNELPEPFDLLSIEVEPMMDGVSFMERYEGMYVQVESAQVVAPTNQFDEFAISITGENAYREMGIETDNTPQFAGMGLPEFDLNHELIEVDPDESGLPIELVNIGSTITATGSLSYDYQDYQLWPSELTIDANEFQPRAVRAVEDGEFSIATQNVENFFDILDDEDRDDATFEDYVPDTEEAYQVRLNKMSLQVLDVLNAPDVIAMQEMENINALSDLANQIATDGGVDYFACLEEGNDGRGIDNAFLVRTDRVAVNSCDTMDGALDAPFQMGGELFGRPPLVLDADLLGEDGTSTPVLIINLHNKSLSGIDTNRTQLLRLDQAIYIAEFVQAQLDENPDRNIIVLGDINAFEFSDGIVDVVGVIMGTYEMGTALKEPEANVLSTPLINQGERANATERFTFIFNSTRQALDHILTTPSVDAWVTDIQYSRGNAEALRSFEEIDGTPIRSADHDGIILYIKPE